MRVKPVVPALVMLAAILVLVHNAGAANHANGRGWAIVVGVDRYDTADISPLSFAGADARTFAQTLVENCGFSPDRVFLMTSDSDAKQRPNSENVLEWLEAMRREVGPNDTFVFYFSGHGVTRQGSSYLLTTNTRLGSEALLRKSALSVTEIKDALKGIRAARLLQIVDACRNDPGSSRGLGDNKMSPAFSRDLSVVAQSSPQIQGSVTATLFACSEGQRSYEGYKGHGYFTYFLVQGLKGEARDPSRRDGGVTLSSLVAYLADKVPEAVRIYAHGQPQVPYASIDGTGHAFVLSQSSNAASNSSVSTATDPQPRPTSVPTSNNVLWRIEPGRGYGPFLLGMSRTDAVAEANKLIQQGYNIDIHVGKDGSGDLWCKGFEVTLHNDKVLSVLIDKPATCDGLLVCSPRGATLADVIAHFGPDDKGLADAASFRSGVLEYGKKLGLFFYFGTVALPNVEPIAKDRVGTVIMYLPGVGRTSSQSGRFAGPSSHRAQ